MVEHRKLRPWAARMGVRPTRGVLLYAVRSPTPPEFAHQHQSLNVPTTGRSCGVGARHGPSRRFGPPGTGKTLLARAVATAFEGAFLPLAIPDLLKSMVRPPLYDGARGLTRPLTRAGGRAGLPWTAARGQVGESERALARAFRAARQSAPCVIFVDEIDALFGRKDSDDAMAPGHGQVRARTKAGGDGAVGRWNSSHCRPPLQRTWSVTAS